MKLIDPMPVIQPAAGVVPGGPVYEFAASILAWITGKGPAPKPTPSPVPIPGPIPGSLSAVMVGALNVERGKNGLPSLRVDQKLTDMAAYWATSMARSGVMSHAGFARCMNAVYPNSKAGEIVAEGARTTPEVVGKWMGSSGHKANILGDFTAAGAGVAYSSNGTRFDCVDFVK